MRHHFHLEPLSATSSVVNASIASRPWAPHKAGADTTLRVGPLHGVVVLLVAVQLYALTVWIGRRLARRTSRSTLPVRM